ncbi:unnamed protein product [Protopolystoma xenopodis]|uniref:Cadherin domain-containing protein n=1 Tax=Protopolystoma xenopodis TaxID=117903 RepID=A0A3S5AXR9_9PLAT|nr:unnamed protein product [Protopolystoma xenopodis]
MPCAANKRLFTIGSTDGILALKDRLDREAFLEHMLVICARDGPTEVSYAQQHLKPEEDPVAGRQEASSFPVVTLASPGTVAAVRLSACLEVHVTVGDVNDEPPRLSLASSSTTSQNVVRLSLSVSEDAEPGSRVGERLEFVDEDVAASGTLGEGFEVRLVAAELGLEPAFGLVPAVAASSAWRLPNLPGRGPRCQAYWLMTRRRLDREQTAVHRFRLLAVDPRANKPGRSRGSGQDSSPGLTSTVEVEVRLQDVNDCAPQFLAPAASESDTTKPRPAAPDGVDTQGGWPDNPVQVSWREESGSRIYKLVARDNDAGRNGSVEYSLLGLVPAASNIRFGGDDGAGAKDQTGSRKTKPTNGQPNDRGQPFLSVEPETGWIRLTRQLTKADLDRWAHRKAKIYFY